MGAAPIQNIGAYGVEIAARTEAVRVIDRQRGVEAVLSPDECEFCYRSSVFKSQPDRYVVVDLTLRLTRCAPVLDYPDVQVELTRLGWSKPTPRQVAEAGIPIPSDHPRHPHQSAKQPDVFVPPTGPIRAPAHYRIGIVQALWQISIGKVIPATPALLAA